MSQKKNNSISITEPLSIKDLRVLKKHKRIDSLSITKQRIITLAIAKGFTALQSLGHLFLWSPVTRNAMKYIISIPDLEELDIFEIRHPGKLDCFSSANTLKIFRCNFRLSENDLIEIARLPKLEELGAQHATITVSALTALLDRSHLMHLDLEGTDFDDEMAKIIMRSTKIETLYLGATKLTAKGLASLCHMSQLRSLDIWAIDIIEQDLDLLSKLTKLEYLSIGGCDGQTKLTSKGVIPYLNKIPSLRKIWLDGITVSNSEENYLKQQYNYVQLTSV